MTSKTVQKQNTVHNSKFLSLISKSKQDFVKEYKKFDIDEKRSLCVKVLYEIEPSITEGNLDLCKKFNNILKYIDEIEDAEALKDLLGNANNPLKNTNMIILACKYNQASILDYALDMKKNSDTLFPQDSDESSHNAFYYAIRSSNIKLLEKLVDKWPTNYFAENG